MAIRNFTDLAYSKSVKTMQSHLGARARNEELEREARNTEVTDALSAYLAERTSILLGTAAKSGWPYVQHRGGPRPNWWRMTGHCSMPAGRRDLCHARDPFPRPRLGHQLPQPHPAAFHAGRA